VSTGGPTLSQFCAPEHHVASSVSTREDHHEETDVQLTGDVGVAKKPEAGVAEAAHEDPVEVAAGHSDSTTVTAALEKTSAAVDAGIEREAVPVSDAHEIPSVAVPDLVVKAAPSSAGKDIGKNK
jgi:hypothetical protein